jgi:lipopolysaccharide export system permease protein
LYLTLYDGVVHESQADREGGFQRIYFEHQVVPLRGVGNELERRLGGTDRSDREMSIALLSGNARQREAELDSVRTANRRDALRAVHVALDEPSKTDSTGVFTEADIGAWRARSTASSGSRDALTQEVAAEARSRAARGGALEQTVNRFNVEIHKKLAIAFACIVFSLIGPPLALRFPRGGVGLVIAASTVIFSVYWVGLIAGESLADRRVADPAVTMWLSNVVFLIAGILLAARMGRTSVNTRGGGVDELWQSLRAKLPGKLRTAARVAAEAS